MNTELPDASRVRELLKRYVRVRLEVDTGSLGERDRLALRQLIESASWVNRIFWKQRSHEGQFLRNSLSNSKAKDAVDLERLLDINFGPWDNFDNDRPFWGAEKRPPGGNLYPADLTKEELEAYLERHPEEQASLLSHTTLVRREGDRLRAIPYHEAYQDELSHIASGLMKASELVTHQEFGDFLRARAKGLVSGSLTESEKRWINVAGSPIDIAIGPYEVYDDGLLGVKASYEATVMVRHEMSEQLTHFEEFAPQLERRLPGAIASGPNRRKFSIGVYDVVFTAGMTNMGGKAIAATLPNDESVRSEFGARLMLFRNVISAKFAPILKPLGTRILRKDQLDLVQEDAFLYHTLLHEMAHAVSTCFVTDGDSTGRQTINDALKERYSSIEECRADLLGMVFLNLGVENGLFAKGMNASAAVTFVVNSVRALRFGGGDDYSKGASIILSELLRRAAIRAESDGTLFVDAERVRVAVGDLAETVQDISARGDYDAAGALVQKYGSIPSEIERLLPRLRDIPIDLEFAFDGSSGAL